MSKFHQRGLVRAAEAAIHEPRIRLAGRKTDRRKNPRYRVAGHHMFEQLAVPPAARLEYAHMGLEVRGVLAYDVQRAPLAANERRIVRKAFQIAAHRLVA